MTQESKEFLKKFIIERLETARHSIENNHFWLAEELMTDLNKFICILQESE